jgi:carbon monoxide dehydrogenase subunit G
MENLKSKIKSMINGIQSLETTKKHYQDDLRSKLGTLEKDRTFKGKIQQRIFSKLIIDKPMSITHIG